MKGLEAARRLYAEKGAAIIHEHFPEYEAVSYTHLTLPTT